MLSDLKTFCLRLCLCLFAAAALPWSAFADSELYGPPNMLKTVPTPFGSVQNGDSPGSGSELSAFTLSGGGSGLRSLNNRLLPPRLYLPGRMVLGQPAEFIVKGRPGSWAALAMADKDSGAKPIYGRNLRLGPDRKLVSLAQIPEGGVLSLVIDTPIQGDLIGQCWYFEAALWSKPDFGDLEIAVPVPSETQAPGTKVNGVVVAPEPKKSRGVRFVPDAAVPLQQIHNSTGLDSGRP